MLAMFGDTKPQQFDLFFNLINSSGTDSVSIKSNKAIGLYLCTPKASSIQESQFALDEKADVEY